MGSVLHIVTALQEVLEERPTHYMADMAPGCHCYTSRNTNRNSERNANAYLGTSHEDRDTDSSANSRSNTLSGTDDPPS